MALLKRFLLSWSDLLSLANKSIWRSAVFVNEVFEGKIVKSQVVISEIKTILWKKSTSGWLAQNSYSSFYSVSLMILVKNSVVK